MDKVILNNGIRVVTEPLPNVRSVAFAVWIKTGSRFETKQNNGISHLIEHMLFKGSKKYDVRTIAQQFDRMGGYVNAFTAKDCTCFYFKVLDEHLPIALDLLSDMIFEPLLDETELEKEKNVIYEEIAMVEDTPDDIVHDLVAEASFGQHPLAFPILGSKQNIEHMSSNRLFRYMQEHYVAENIVISAAGKVDEKSLALIRKAFDRPLVQNESSLGKATAPEFLSEHIFKYKKTEQQHICLALPSVSVSSEQRYVMALLNNLIGGGMSSRLFQEIRENRGLAYSIYSYHSAYEDVGEFVIYAGTAPKFASDLLSATMETLGELIVTGPTEEEVAQNKEQLKGSFILNMESTSTHSNLIGKAELMNTQHESLEETVRKIEQIERADVVKLCRQLFAKPFATAILGETDRVMKFFRSDELALFNKN